MVINISERSDFETENQQPALCYRAKWRFTGKSEGKINTNW